MRGEASFVGRRSRPANFTQDSDIIKFHGSKKPVFSNFSGFSAEEVLIDDPNEKSIIGEGKIEIERVVRIIREAGGIDGFFAFSQGSLMVQVLTLHFETGLFESQLSPQMKPYFAVFFCPLEGFACPIILKMPVFMVFGAFDETAQTGFLMLMRFANTLTTSFEGGHKIPAPTSRLMRLTDGFVGKATREKGAYLNHTSTFQHL